jgi:hypothetical protein
MKKNWLLAVGLALVLAIVGLSGCGSGSASNTNSEELPSNLKVSLNSQQEGIWVAGTGEVFVVPDIVNLRLGIEATEISVAEAETQATEAMNEVMAVLTDSGVVEKDIQTQYFSIRQVTRWDREKEQEVVVGYRVTNMVTAKIRDVDKVGSIIDAVAEAGGDFTRIDSIDFSIDDPSAYYQEAREEAIAEAKDKAEQLAKLAGVKLGKPTYISEGMQVSPIYPRVTTEAVGEVPVPTTPISPGETEISLTVQVGYAILQ